MSSNKLAGIIIACTIAIILTIVIVLSPLMQTPGQQGLPGPQGEQGPQGPAGPQGSAGPSMIVAMGTVYSLTEALSNLYNVTSVTWNPDWQQWWIRLTDIEYFITDYVTIVTAIGDEYAGCSSQGDLLAITLYDSDGAKTKGVGFSFVVLAAP